MHVYRRPRVQILLLSLHESWAGPHGACFIDRLENNLNHRRLRKHIAEYIGRPRNFWFIKPAIAAGTRDVEDGADDFAQAGLARASTTGRRRQMLRTELLLFVRAATCIVEVMAPPLKSLPRPHVLQNTPSDQGGSQTLDETQTIIARWSRPGASPNHQAASANAQRRQCCR